MNCCKRKTEENSKVDDVKEMEDVDKDKDKEEPKGHYVNDENTERGNWNHPMEFIMSCVGVIFGHKIHKWNKN